MIKEYLSHYHEALIFCPTKMVNARCSLLPLLDFVFLHRGSRGARGGRGGVTRGGGRGGFRGRGAVRGSGRGRGAARGGRGRGGRGRSPPKSASALDSELDAYMASANMDDQLLM